MRRKDKEISELSDKLRILNECKVCRIGLLDGDEIYIVPLNFGFEFCDEKLILYFHCAKTGRKIEILNKNPKVGFEMDCGHELVEDEIACKHTFKYSSVIGNGFAEFLDNSDEKINAFKIIMKHQIGKDFEFYEKTVNAVTVFKVTAQKFSCKGN